MTNTLTMQVSQLQGKERMLEREALTWLRRLNEEMKAGDYRTAAKTAEYLADTLSPLASTLKEIQSHDL
jgi:hypothetical protein